MANLPDGTMVAGKFDHQPVERFARNTGVHMRHQHVERLCGEMAGLVHGGEGIRSVKLDLAGTELGSFC